MFVERFYSVGILNDATFKNKNFVRIQKESFSIFATKSVISFQHFDTNLHVIYYAEIIKNVSQKTALSGSLYVRQKDSMQILYVL